MVLLAHISPATEGRERRRDERRLVTLVTNLAESSDQDTTIRILNLSRTGLLFEADASFEVGEIFLLDLPEVGTTSVRVRRKDGQRFGCEFLSAVTHAAVSAALLKSSPSIDEADDAAPAAVAVPVEYEMNPREPHFAATFAIVLPFGVLLVGIAFALAFLQVG